MALYVKHYLQCMIWNLQEFVSVDNDAQTMFHTLSPSAYCRYVQIHPVSWVEKIALRVELYGYEAGKQCRVYSVHYIVGSESCRLCGLLNKIP